MSFFASNDRIQITNNAGGVVFDTTKPMPHILQWLNSSASVTFPNIPCQENNAENSFQSPSCRYQRLENYCERVQVCERVQKCTFTNGVNLCQWINECKWETQCGNRWVWEDGYLVDWRGWFDYQALNWSTVVDLGPVDNGLDADFILVNAVCNRTQQGSLVDIGGLPCGLPLNANFSANGSSIVESASNVADGSPWITRIMSVFIEGGRLKVEFKHTNRAQKSVSEYTSSWCERGTPKFPPGKPERPPDASSAYNFSFEIVIGKFIG